MESNASNSQLEEKYSEAVLYIDRLHREKVLLEGQKRAITEQLQQTQAELKERPTVRELKTLQEALKTYKSPISNQSQEQASGEECRRVLYELQNLLGVK
mmetsp:Transcript_27121/g.5011  ORF Transcript_27121/g.5011 Transcript_27121/m.5011 type:complete len:100 (+) Transcript_27121:1002-1301(+)